LNVPVGGDLGKRALPFSSLGRVASRQDEEVGESRHRVLTVPRSSAVMIFYAYTMDSG
jgi:hypothetical protein